MLSFPDFEKEIKSPLLTKGKNAYQENLVKEVHILEKNHWKIFIQSESSDRIEYIIDIAIHEGKVIKDECTCLGSIKGEICKHRIAALMEIKAQNLYDRKGDKQFLDHHQDIKDETEKVIRGEKPVNKAQARHLKESNIILVNLSI